MKKLLAVLVLVLFGAMSYAQWSPGPGNLYMLSSGNVGIGTTTPANRLVIETPAGAADFYLQRPLGAVPTGSNPIGQFRMYNNGTVPAGTGAGDYFNFSFRLNAGKSEIVQSAYEGATGITRAFAFFQVQTGKYEVRAGVVDVEYQNTGKVYFNNAGGVGIGMGTYAMPSGAKLAVNGKAVVKEIEVTLTGMPPDYVFDKNYKLRSLYDVENFINTNKHLPDVPSATQMTSGVNLGDMSATLLKKVEELTLYMIDLKKENDALKARISRLEK